MTDDYQDREWPTARKIQVLGGSAGVVAVLAIALYAAQPTTGSAPVADTTAHPAATAGPAVSVPAMLTPDAQAAPHPPAAQAPATLAPAAAPAPGPVGPSRAPVARRTGPTVPRAAAYFRVCRDPDHDHDCDSYSHHLHRTDHRRD
jgi:hypothetical protein